MSIWGLVTRTVPLPQKRSAKVSTWNTPSSQNLSRPVTPAGETIIEGDYVVDDTPIEESPVLTPPKPRRTLLQPKRAPAQTIDFFAMRQLMGRPEKAKGRQRKQESDDELQLALF